MQHGPPDGATHLPSVEKSVLIDICLGAPLGALAFGRLSAAVTGEAQPRTTLFRGEQLLALKQAFAAGDGRAAEAVAALVASAEAVMGLGPFSVVDKTALRFSDDPHDYQSLSKYWWPNPDSPDGLPYVRRDGDVNPTCYSDAYDYVRLIRFAETATLLALSGWLAGRADLTARAATLLRTWFLDPATRQNPDFAHAQGIPGHSEPRWNRVVEARHLVYVAEAVALVEHADPTFAADAAAIRDWYGRLLDWLLALAEAEAAPKNNLAFWLHVQIMGHARFVGREAVVAEIVRTGVLPSLIDQMADDGSLPRELTRAHPYDYVAFTVAAMALISRAGEGAGVELWDHDAGDGRNFQAAQEWLKQASAADALRPLIGGTETGVPAELGLAGDAALAFRAVALAALIEHAAAEGVRGGMEAVEAKLAAAEAEAEKLPAETAARQAAEAGAAALRERTSLLEKTLDRLQVELSESGRKLEAERSAVKRLTAEKAQLEAELSEAQRDAQSLHADLEASEMRRRAAESSGALTLSQRDAFVDYARTVEERLTAMRESRLWRFARALRLAPKDAPPKRPVLPGPAGGRPSAAAAVDQSADANGGAAQAKGGEAGGLFRMLRDNRDRVARTARSAGGPRPAEEAALRAAFEGNDLAAAPDTFVLTRVIGNDLVPRHEKGQSRANVSFILDHEASFPDCQKRWIVNRIVDPEEERQIIALLESRGQAYMRIPFDPAEYARVGWDFGALPARDFLFSQAFDSIGDSRRDRAMTALHRHKNNYVMNNNGARNAALREGRGLAKWVMPFDGNCFITAKAFSEIRDAVSARPHLKYFVVPMARITDNADLLKDDFSPDPVEEPQILFRADAAEEFNPEFCYGRRPKVELFWRLGVPGDWDDWKNDEWDLPRPPLSREARQFGRAGWVARLFSGVRALEEGGRETFKNRGLVRQEAIVTTIERVDLAIAAEERDPLGLTLYASSALQAAAALPKDAATPAAQAVAALLAEAAAALGRGPYSVVDKTTLPPSGDPHDYWHPAPYWWPNPETKDGLPYVKRDGERVPGTQMFSPESDRFDRTRAQRLFDDVTTLSLAAAITGGPGYAEHAVRLIDRWFLDPATMMRPHLAQAQVRLGHSENRGNSSGVIEMKDFYYFLDACRLLEVSGALDGTRATGLRNWLAEYLAWLVGSPLGKREKRSTNNHGVHYDLHVASVAEYVGRRDVSRHAMLRALSRLPVQIDEQGRQPEEIARTGPAHYCCFSLQGWMNLLLIFRRAGLRPGPVAEEPIARLQAALDFIFAPGSPVYQTEANFDPMRLAPLALMARENGFALDADGIAARFGERAVYSPYDGIPPYWRLALREAAV